ncbi:MAG: TonB-dependent receptor [Bacteroidales bacterium]|nr:TonB-dependent receptor [Bacteroidales bacterium]MCF8352106.1 TonB-dependent receptor [Bacteroidales bacterium]MCF8377306.1 TonB-dependent receptor [Bacteroidales bacterium]MCF8401390.1 TonB-dependent receptor [Bacteroidales bacterium]
MKTKLIIIIWGVLFASAVFAQNGKIVGKIYNTANNEPIPFANIVIWNTNIGSTSDLDGNFTFTGLEPGYIRLEASAVGFEKYVSEEILVTNARTANIELPMQEKQVELKTVEIRASPFIRKEESPLSLRTLSISEIERNPGGNRDISRVLQSLPGVSSTVSFRNDVIVRGGGASENSFYLDGIEIPTLNHFSTQGASGGPVGIINVDFVREVEFYSGAFPANRGNALSSIIEFEQIDPNMEEWGFRAAVGASDLAFTANGPVSGKSGLIFSLRRSYLGFLFDVIGLPFLPTYNDAQFKYKHKFDNKNQLTLIGLGAIDHFELNTGIENPDEEQRYILGYLPVNEQYSYTVGANFKHFRDNGFNTIVFSRNYLNNTAYKYLNNNEIDSLKTFDYKSIESENKLRVESFTRTGGYKLNYGLGAAYAEYSNNTFQKVFIRDSLRVLNYNSSIDLFNYNAFAQISKGIFSERLILSLGVRFDGTSYSKEMANPVDQFSPRFSASYALTDVWFLNFNTGIYYQRPPYTTMGFRNNAGILVNKENGLKYIRADHLVAGLEFLPDNRSKITLEGFYKYYRDYPFSVDDSVSIANKGGDFGTYGDEEVISVAEGRAYGFEVLARDKDFMGFNVILSYTFVRSEFQKLKGGYIPSKWDNRHILNLTVLKELKRNWDVGFKWRFVGGAPYTPYDLMESRKRPAWDARGRGYLDYERYNSLRLGNFQQLDVRVDKQYFFDKWSLILYLDIQNLYNFKAEQQDNLTNLDENGIPVIINPDDPYPEQVYELRRIESESGTVLPTIGIIVEF